MGVADRTHPLSRLYDGPASTYLDGFYALDVCNCVFSLHLYCVCAAPLADVEVFMQPCLYIFSAPYIGALH
jgi:hypothetical protein